ncbi:hypothetical protein GCM10028799_23310 [Kribbella italica]
MNTREPTVEETKGSTVYIYPVTVIEKVRREANSALPNAPVVPELEVPRRHPLRALRRWARRPPRVVCEADRRDRSAQVASTAGPC